MRESFIQITVWPHDEVIEASIRNSVNDEPIIKYIRAISQISNEKRLQEKQVRCPFYIGQSLGNLTWPCPFKTSLRFVYNKGDKATKISARRMKVFPASKDTSLAITMEVSR